VGLAHALMALAAGRVPPSQRPHSAFPPNIYDAVYGVHPFHPLPLHPQNGSRDDVSLDSIGQPSAAARWSRASHRSPRFGPSLPPPKALRPRLHPSQKGAKAAAERCARLTQKATLSPGARGSSK
jgi:hypothetical protein